MEDITFESDRDGVIRGEGNVDGITGLILVMFWWWTGCYIVWWGGD